jgi:predicted small lipoprotein YifL
MCLTATLLAAQQTAAANHVRTTRFLSQRTTTPTSNTTVAEALQQAREQHLSLLQQRTPLNGKNTASLTAAWQAIGPSSVLSPTFGNLTGRITAIAPDPNDASGNTVYLGTTGGGVWKSINAAGPLAAVSFTPLTDTLPVFSGNTSMVPSLSIGAVAVQPSVNPIVLAGTGDPNDATDSYYGEGLLRSADNGLTWTLIQNSQDGANGNHSFLGLATSGIAFSSATPSLVVAAFSTSAEGALVAATNIASVPGLYYSTDAGVTWQMATISDGANIVQQPQPLGTGQVGNSATSVVWDAVRSAFFAAVRSHGYYASTDGIHWTRLAAQPGTNLTTANCPVGANGVGSATCPVFRGVITAQPVTGDLYALTVDASDLDQGLWQDLCNAVSNTCSNTAPTFANRIDNSALEAGNGSTVVSQGSYDLALAAAPATNGSTVLFVGAVDLYRCSIAENSTSCALRNTTNALDGCNAPAKVAPSQHALATVSLAAAPLLYVGNDGGLWRSLDGVVETGSVCSATDATHFDNLNAAIGTGGSLAEITGFAQHPTDPNTLLAGLGEDGSAATTTASTLTAWPQLSAGEGGTSSLDPNTPANWFLTIGAGVNLAACSLGSACTAANFVPPSTIGEPQVNNDTALLDAPSLLDPALTTNILVSTCRVWRGPASTTSAWSIANAISPALNNSSTPCTASSPLIRSLGAGGPGATSTSPQLAGSSVLYAGLSGKYDGGANIAGHLFVTTTANTSHTWTDTALPNANGFDVSAIAVDPHDATGGTVYATVMGFGVPHVLRSINFGNTWTNVSANLPDAPANAVLIDPNDANTVYVALDTGIYVTQAISTCSSTNCWSVLGTSLPNAPIVALAAAAMQPTGDGRLGMLRAATYGRGIWQLPLITALPIAQPAITLSATSFTFAAQQVSTQSSAQTLTITSSGNAPITFGTPTLSGDFIETDNCAGSTLAVNATCTVQIVFAPTATGTRNGQITIYANISGGQAIATLTGVGTAPASIVLTPASLAFAATVVNQTTAAQIITIANTGGTSATLQTPTVTGDFAIDANTCGATLAASTACAVSITFTPTTSGSRTGIFSITDTVGTQTAQLSGSGQAPATDTLSTSDLSFPQQQITTTSAAQTVTLTNAGGVALTLITASVSPGDFNVTNFCGNSLAANASCSISVTFTPTAIGTRTATLTVMDQFRSQAVTLTGTGVAPPGVSLSPATLSFSATGVGLSSLPQTLTLTNNGGLPLTIASILASSNFTIATNSCPSTLAANMACALQIIFTPSAAGPVAGTLTFTDNAPSGTQTTSLSGIGVDFTLAANGPTTATLNTVSTTPATYNLLLSSVSSLNQPVALSCKGAPANAICTVTPTTPSLGSTVSILVSVQTGVKTGEIIRPTLPWFKAQDAVYLALLLPLCVVLRRRRAFLLFAVLAMTFTSLTGCGTGRYIPPSSGNTNPSNPTPAGTYNLTVTASAANISHAVGLTLIVQ